MNETVLRETQSEHDAYCNSDDDQDERDETATEPQIFDGYGASTTRFALFANTSSVDPSL